MLERRHKGIASPLQHPGVFINDARRHVGMVMILTAVRIHASLKHHMQIWQEFLFNVFYSLAIFLDKEEHPLLITPTKKLMVPHLFQACLMRPEKIHGWKHNQTFLLLSDVSWSRMGHEWPCIKLQAFWGWNAFSGLWLKFYTLQEQTFPSLLGCFNFHILGERTFPLEPSRIFMVFLMCPKVIIGT